MSGPRAKSKAKPKAKKATHERHSDSGSDHTGAHRAGQSSGSRLGPFYASGPVFGLGTPVQAKLVIGRADDPYEREADAVAEQVTRGSSAPAISSLGLGGFNSIPQRQEEDAEEPLQETSAQRQEGEEEPIPELSEQRQEEPVQKMTQQASKGGIATPDIERAIQGIRGGGRPLAPAIRTFMEPRFGYNFDHVRVHTDTQAAEVAQALNAQAFTVGHEMAFRAGQYAPRTIEGQKLLAHELTHTIQQQRRSRSAFVGNVDVLRVPAAPSDLTRDHTKLRIKARISLINYFEFIRQNKTIAVDYTSPEWSLSSEWKLYDARDTLVDTNTEVGGGRYDLTADILREHVDKTGPSAFGTWTLRYEKGSHYDDITFTVQQLGIPTPAMADAETTAALYSLRQMPGRNTEVVGNLPGRPVSVTVYDKAMVDGEVWYQIELKTELGSLAKGARVWVIANGKNGEAGMTAAVRWDFFRKQLRQFETKNSDLSLDQRITMLRQMGHEEDVPFDSVIGTQAGTDYLDTRGFVKNVWEIMKDYQIVRMPDGEKVDVFHLLVGLDVLTRRVPSQTYWGYDIGQNYSAATWAGDIGAAAADAFRGQDKDWEEANGIPPPGDSKRARHLGAIWDRYYTTRVPESDLLGNVDAWGINRVRAASPSLDSIERLLVAYYEKTSPASAGSGSGKALTTGRKAAIETFLADYGFHTASPLKSQEGARATMATQIRLFAEMWLRKRRQSLSSGNTTDLNSLYVLPMTDRFLRWLEALAKANGAVVPPKKEKVEEQGSSKP